MLKRIVTALVSLLALLAAGLVAPQSASAGDFTLSSSSGAIAWSSDGRYAYFGPATQVYGFGEIKRLDLSNGTVTTIVNMTDPYGCHAHPSALAITPDDSTLLVGGYSCALTIPLANPSAYTSTYTGFDWATRVVAGVNSGYVVGSGGGKVYKIAKVSGTWGPSWTFLQQNSAETSRGLALSPDETTLYLSFGSQNVRVINTTSGAETALAASGASHAIAMAPDGSYLLYTDGGRVLRKFILTGPDTGTITSRSYADEWGMQKMVMDPTGTYAYVGSVWSRSIVKIRTSDLGVEERISLTQAYPTLSADAPTDLAASPSASRANAANELLVSIGPISTIAQFPSAPYAPSSLSVLPADESATVSFTAGAAGGSTITNYEYRLNGAGAWTALSPADVTSPVTIPGLTNGTQTSIELRAVNAQGSGTASSSVTVTPQSTPRSPLNVSGSTANGQVTVSFSAPASDGGFPITNYEVSTDNGATWTAQNPAVTSGPITVGGLTNGVQYLVAVRAVNALGSGTGSTPIGLTPNVVSSGSSSNSTASPSPSASASPTPSPTAMPPAQVAVPEPVAVGQGLVVVDGRVTKVAVNSVNGRTWQVLGDDFSLEFIPEALTGDLDGSFTARAGTKVAVRGDGFLAGSLIATYLPGALADSLGQSTVDSDGSFSVTASIPSTLSTGTYVFQVNGLSTPESVRSVNLGMRLLPALPSAKKAASLRVSFTAGKPTISAGGTAALTAFVRRHASSAQPALIVPTVRAGATSADLALARQRALAVRQALKSKGFDEPIHISGSIRRSKDVAGISRTTLWVRKST